MKLSLMLVLCIALALAVGVTAAAADSGNSDSAKACQKGGWQNLVRASDSSDFKNEGDCVSYAAQGGTLGTKTKSQLDCEAAGGSFSTDPASETNDVAPGSTFMWTCNGLANAQLNLVTDCVQDAAPKTTIMTFSLPPVVNQSCRRF